MRYELHTLEVVSTLKLNTAGNGHTATIADPESITPEECLELARCGADEWNRWREKYPVHADPLMDDHRNNVNFEGVDFRQFEYRLDFSNFHFGAYPNFSGAKFGDDIKFSLAVFGEAADFERAEFGIHANFKAAWFKNNCNFVNSKWGEEPSFYGAQFGGIAHFQGAVWVGAYFLGAQFENGANFDNSCFNDYDAFRPEFKQLFALFSSANFESKSWHQLENVYQENFRERQGWAESRGMAPDTLPTMRFRGAVFSADLSFSGRKFNGDLDFGKTRDEKFTTFTRVPVLDGCTFARGIHIKTTKFPDPSGDEGAIASYRKLKLTFSQQQATREEQHFFKLEMKEEAAAESGCKRWLYRAYQLTSNFGFSIARPTWLLFISVMIAGAFYALQAGLHLCNPFSAGCNMTGPMFQFTLGHALPGFEKFAEPASKLLFGEHNEKLGVWTVLTLLLQKAVSVLALFLIGLALRNLFKMK